MPSNRNGGADAQRKRLYGRIHKGAKALFGDVSKGGTGREDYEDWLEAQTGKRSCSKMTVAQLVGLTAALSKSGAFDGLSRGGSGTAQDGSERPTTQQWAKMGAMARARGWKGLEDQRFQKFVERTTGTKARWITRKQASDVILGLEAWARDGEGGGDAVS